MSLIDNLPLRATERDQYTVRQYYDGGLVRATLGIRLAGCGEGGIAAAVWSCEESR